MLFFEVEAKIKDKKWSEIFNDRELFRDATHDFESKVTEYNSKAELHNWIFVYCLNKTYLTAGVIMTERDNLDTRLPEFFESIGMNVADIEYKEIMIERLVGMVRSADRSHLIEDDYGLLEKFGIDDFGRFGRSIEIDETIIQPFSKDTTYKKAKKHFAPKEFMSELDRIYADCKPREDIAHPVHYVFEMDEKRTSSPLIELLGSSLYANKRILSKRIAFADLARSKFSKSDLETIFESSIGGTVVIECPVEIEEESDHASAQRDFFESVCKIIKKYRNKVLVILSFPSECKRIKSMFYDCLANMTFVEIPDELMKEDRAKQFLNDLAKKNKIRSDKKIMDRIEPDETYYAKDLFLIFDEWFSNKLKNTVYPQYKELEVINPKTINENSKGFAYDELFEMIGLDSAKKVIDKSLDYYKAQRLFADKGIDDGRPAMHMVFTGNPGTAKTSVARLFARILRENKILSEGHLVELGRSDLVAKYVGWTADAVKRAFSRAKGGVLFIDEAYSLVDDRDGSFGDEAINTIVQEMENKRDQVVVIFAGYPKKMEKFLDKNPGLRSRIAFHVPFDDYSTDELCDIAKLMAKKQELNLTDDALEKMQEVFAVAREDEEFGNGRFVRNMLEDARMAQASRLVEMDFDEVKKKDVHTIIADDIEMPAAIEKNQERVNLGFTS
ncbi:MAG: AAA family ATPase [Eubacterium sp.]|nr:AAA family ATPase [Eubacterium sp.]